MAGRGAFYSGGRTAHFGGRLGGRGQGRSNPQIQQQRVSETSLKGLDTTLPYLHYGGSSRDNRPIEFLKAIGEYCDVKMRPSIGPAFSSSPPAFGAYDDEPIVPVAPEGAALSTIEIQEYLHLKKLWITEKRDAELQRKSVFAIVWGQLSSASRCEVEDDDDWIEQFEAKNLLYLITRIRATHIARQSGNPAQDKERVRKVWSDLYMSTSESHFSFRTRVENYQLERLAVGLAILPDDELIIGVINRLDMHRYGELVRNYMTNEARDIKALPTNVSKMWTDIKQTNVVRFRGQTIPTKLESVYLATQQELSARNRFPRGGKGRGNTRPQRFTPPSSATMPHQRPPTVHVKTAGQVRPPHAPPTRDIICYNCGEAGHRSTVCPHQASVLYTDSSDVQIFLSSVTEFDPSTEDDFPDSPIYLSRVSITSPTTLLLDTQASIHIVCNPELLTSIKPAEVPIFVQGITRDRIKVHEEGILYDLGVQSYFSPSTAANILSYSMLQTTHTCTYNTDDDTFTAVPILVGPPLLFSNVMGHYTLDLKNTVSCYMSTVSHSSYTKREIAQAKLAYDFILRMGFISYKSAAEMIQRASMAEMGFTRADLINAQLIYGTPPAYTMGHGTTKNVRTSTQELVPTDRARPQQLQVDLFYIFGQVFLLSISVIMGLIIVSHLGPGIDRSESRGPPAKARSQAGAALLKHIRIYDAKGFTVSTVTSDGEPSIAALKSVLEEENITLNILGHGSHVPHAEAAIRHIKNKARSTAHSLPYDLPSKWAPHLVTFVTYTANMVPKTNSPDHTPAYTSFTGLMPNFKKQTPHPFGVSGFLQRPVGPQYNSSSSRADYVIWLGTTRNLAGTHRCFNLTTLQEMTGDTFTPAPITHEAILRINRMAGTVDLTPVPAQLPLSDPTPPYALDPLRGVQGSHSDNTDVLFDPTIEDVPSAPAVIVSADSILAAALTGSEATSPYSTPAPSSISDPDQELQPDQILADDVDPVNQADNNIESSEMAEDPELQHDLIPADEVGLTDVAENLFQLNEPSDESTGAELQDAEGQVHNVDNSEDIASQLATVRGTQRYNLRSSTIDRHVFSVMSYSEATNIYGPEAVREAGITEIRNCIDKQVWECILPQTKIFKPIPSKLFLTPKMTPSGQFKLLKGRIVGGGHRQDHSQFSDSEISSPTVSLTAVMIGAAVASHRGQLIMTLDHKAAYLNAVMKGPEVIMLLPPDVSHLLIELDPSHSQYLRSDKRIAVRLKKALYGCIQSAVLWYNELSSTIEGMGFVKNPYDLCSFRRVTDNDECNILVYVDDLLITSTTPKALHDITSVLKTKYGGITTTEGLLHDYLGIRWDFTVPKQVSLSMEGYTKELLEKYKPFKAAKTPASSDLFECKSSSAPLGKTKRDMFHSATMTLHYLAKRVRPDILAAVSYCATRVLAPTEHDLAKLQRILGYLSITTSQQLLLKVGDSISIRAYVDSSFGTYDDCKSVTGTAIFIGGAPVYFKSSKQKIVTRSSTEAELVGISDALSQILWTREYVIHQGIEVGPAILYQDNMSTIFLANKGRSTSERTRHIKIRFFFVTHYIESKEIIIEHMPTSCMIADALTKPLHGTLFTEMTAALTGHPHNLGK